MKGNQQEIKPAPKILFESPTAELHSQFASLGLQCTNHWTKRLNTLKPPPCGILVTTVDLPRVILSFPWLSSCVCHWLLHKILLSTNIFLLAILCTCRITNYQGWKVRWRLYFPTPISFLAECYLSISICCSLPKPIPIWPKVSPP